MKYSALIADIVESRSYKNRFVVQKMVKETIDFLNEFFLEEIQIQVEISSGDSIQGLFKSTSSSYLYYRFFELFLYPVRVRAGISYDSLDYMENWSSNEMDGLAYQRAHEALQMCKDKDYKILIKTGQIEDQSINMMMQMPSIVDRVSSLTSNLVQLISEFLFPLYIGKYFKGNQHPLDMERLKRLIELKKEIITSETTSKKLNQFPNINYDLLKKFLWVEQRDEREEEKDQLIYQSYWKKGFSTKVADILGMSRQVVDRNYGYLNYAYLRNLDATIVSSLKQYYKEEL